MHIYTPCNQELITILKKTNYSNVVVSSCSVVDCSSFGVLSLGIWDFSCIKSVSSSNETFVYISYAEKQW